MSDPLVLILLAVAVGAILTALFAPAEDDPLVVTFPGQIAADNAEAILRALRNRRPNDPLLLSEGASVSRIERRRHVHDESGCGEFVQMGVPAQDPIEYLIDRIDASGDCWLWTGAKGRDGYGHALKHNPTRWQAAHRAIYEWLVGPVERSLHLDHLCRNKLCVNPDHLEPVTRRENILRGYSPQAMNARQTHCRRGGHPLSGDNLYVHNGLRSCRTCLRERQRRTAVAA